MAADEKNIFDSDISLPETTALELLGRQSVRATFRLTEKAIETLSVISVQLGIKQKSLFDHLIEDVTALEGILKEIDSRDFQRSHRIQKTYVLSRKTLSSLERAAKIFDAPRDILVEYSIQRLRPVLRQEREKHEKRKMILQKVTEHLKKGEEILVEARQYLGENDPIFLKIASAVSACRSAQQNIELTIEKGKCVEMFE